ncbi:hypothetical protein B296_00048115 [Ensete ventricosum]|uniref:Uncharacterized protein n=1 Tax=Ensete ventricosum TaxID=4639 RepID=A0A426XWR2_ENSVE|nr:hypothetical protein B296_00048115 [Ensete ventricosum]
MEGRVPAAAAAKGGALGGRTRLGSGFGDGVGSGTRACIAGFLRLLLLLLLLLSYPHKEEGGGDGGRRESESKEKGVPVTVCVGVAKRLDPHRVKEPNADSNPTHWVRVQQMGMERGGWHEDSSTTSSNLKSSAVCCPQAQVVTEKINQNLDKS